MTPEQALDLLNQLRLRIEMKGQDHELARQAYETLKIYLEPKLNDKKSEAMS